MYDSRFIYINTPSLSFGTAAGPEKAMNLFGIIQFRSPFSTLS